MKREPYYWMKLEKVGKIIVNAVKKQRRVEMVSILNLLVFYVRFLPVLSDLIYMGCNFLLTKRIKNEDRDCRESK